MARKSRLDLRKEAEAAEAMGVDGSKAATKKKRKKATKRKATKRSKAKAVVRKRLVWGVFSSSLKEEARFPYDQRQAADEKAVQLAAKTKRTYFVQPIKEALAESDKIAAEIESDDEDLDEVEVDEIDDDNDDDSDNDSDDGDDDSDDEEE